MPQRNLRRFALWGTWKKNVSFYEAERFVLFFRNASFCGLYLLKHTPKKYEKGSHTIRVRTFLLILSMKNVSLT